MLDKKSIINIEVFKDYLMLINNYVTRYFDNK